ncbi:MAG: dihydrolipoyl dehydrogenase [Phycisphaerales bacterium]|nr:dihydrolipoyl dehydrogenase [Phycisphaerales bacterium]
MADLTHYDLIVIGSGPSGYVGAIRAAQLGMKVCCIERDKLGGVCLNWGCIPTKALLHNAELYMEAIRHGEQWGFDIKPESVKVNWEKVVGRSRSITGQLNAGIAYLFKKNKIDHRAGHAKIVAGKTAAGPCRVEVRKATGPYYKGSGDGDLQTLTADKIIIATGAAPKQLPFAPCDGKTIISSYEAMNLPARPASMLIIGSGAIGMEFAYFYNAFGTKVTVVEMVDRILPIEDDDISAAAQKVFTAQGIEFRVGTSVKAIDKTAKGAKVTLFKVANEKETETVEVETVLVAVGVGARHDGLFDASLGIRIGDSGPNKGHIWTDYRDTPEPTYQTSVAGIYAIGDVIGPPWLAHVASEEAIACVERMKGHHTLGVDYASIPGCTYCNPQIASIGLTEREAKAKGIKYKVGKYPFKSHGKAIAVGATAGLIKVITSDPYGEILGAHIFGEDASELIGEMGLAKRLEATIEDVVSTVHAHPTMHEALKEAVLAVDGRAIHA